MSSVLLKKRNDLRVLILGSFSDLLYEVTVVPPSNKAEITAHTPHLKECGEQELVVNFLEFGASLICSTNTWHN